MAEKNKPKKILVIRSATRVLNQTLLSLREEFPGCQITVLAPESAKKMIEQDPLIDEVLTIPDQRRMSVASYGNNNVRQLQKMNFYMAVSLYNIDHGLGYSNIDLLACAAKAKKVRGYNSRGTFVELDSSTVMKKSFLEKTTFFWVGINYIATSLLFIIITFALMGEWFFRFLFGKKQKEASRSSEEVLSQSPVREPVKATSQA